MSHAVDSVTAELPDRGLQSVEQELRLPLTEPSDASKRAQDIEYAGVVLVSFAFPRSAVARRP